MTLKKQLRSRIVSTGLIISLIFLSVSCGVIDEKKEVFFGDNEAQVLFNKMEEEISCKSLKFNEMVCVDVETLLRLKKEYKRLKRKAGEN